MDTSFGKVRSCGGGGGDVWERWGASEGGVSAGFIRTVPLSAGEMIAGPDRYPLSTATNSRQAAGLGADVRVWGGPGRTEEVMHEVGTGVMQIWKDLHVRLTTLDILARKPEQRGCMKVRSSPSMSC